MKPNNYFARRFLPATILFSAVLLLSGCLDIQIKVTLRQDGSGTISEYVMYGESTTDMMETIRRGNSFGPVFLYDSVEVASHAASYGEGVKLLRIENLVKGKQKGFNAVFGFSDIEKIRIDVAPERPIPKSTADIVLNMTPSYKLLPYTFIYQKGQQPSLIVRQAVDSLSYIDLSRPDNPVVTSLVDTAGKASMINQLVMMLGFKYRISVEPDGSTLQAGKETRLFSADLGKTILEYKSYSKFENKRLTGKKEIFSVLPRVPGFQLATQDTIKIQLKNK